MKKLLLALSVLALAGCGQNIRVTYVGDMVSCDPLGNTHLLSMYSDGTSNSVSRDITQNIQTCSNQSDGSILLVMKNPQK